MMRQERLCHEYVEFIPEKLEPGYLYISHRFKTASHLCCCGCGSRVVTPFNRSKWYLTDHGNSVSLYPSIGNWSFLCRSHYFIDHGRIKWARQMSDRQIANIRKIDNDDAIRLSIRDEGLISWVSNIVKRFLGK